MTDRRRQKKDDRNARKEAERRAAARRELLKRLGMGLGFGVLIIVLFLVFSLRGEEDHPAAYQAFLDQPTACDADAPDPQTLERYPEPEPQSDLEAATSIIATIETSCGEFRISLDTSGTPSVESFVFLARAGFYDGSVFHRVSDNILYGGDPDADGSGNPGYRIPDDPPDSDFVYESGVVALDRRSPNTSGSRFFVVAGEDARGIPPKYNVLGRVVSGMEILEAMAEVRRGRQPGTAEVSRPAETIYIESVTIEVEP